MSSAQDLIPLRVWVGEGPVDLAVHPSCLLEELVLAAGGSIGGQPDVSLLATDGRVLDPLTSIGDCALGPGDVVIVRDRRSAPATQEAQHVGRPGVMPHRAVAGTVAPSLFTRLIGRRPGLAVGAVAVSALAVAAASGAHSPLARQVGIVAAGLLPAISWLWRDALRLVLPTPSPDHPIARPDAARWTAELGSRLGRLRRVVAVLAVATVALVVGATVGEVSHSDPGLAALALAAAGTALVLGRLTNRWGRRLGLVAAMLAIPLSVLAAGLVPGSW